MCPDRQPCVTRQRKEVAFSLLEVLVALSLSLVVVGAIVAFQTYQLTTLSGQAKQLDLQSTARSVVDLAAREVRKTGKNPTCQPAVGGLTMATNQSLRIQTDLDGNGTISGANEDVTYTLDSAAKTVSRVDSAQGGSSTLIDGVDIAGSGFHYFDSNGTEFAAGSTGLDATQRGQVRRVRFDLAMADATGNKGSTGPRVRVSTNLDLRNRFFVADNARCVPTAAPTAAPTGAPQATPTQPLTPVPTVCQLGQKGDNCTTDSQCCSNKCAGNKCN
jgi:type II secretory pathway pseudopilin PulG